MQRNRSMRSMRYLIIWVLAAVLGAPWAVSAASPGATGVATSDCGGAAASAVRLTQGATQLAVDGRTISLPVPIGRDWSVPVRAVVDALGGWLQWHQATRSATIGYNASRGVLALGSRTEQLDGLSATLTVPVTLDKGVLVAPAAAVAPLLGYRLDVLSDSAAQLVPVGPHPAAIEQHLSVGPWTFRLAIGGALHIGTAETPGCDEFAVGGRFVQPTAGRANRHLDIHILDADGMSEVGLVVAVQITAAGSSHAYALPVLELYGKQGPDDDHYGNNLYLPAGTYQITVTARSSTAHFVVKIPSA